ncbi:rhodanese-like domain-containing protein 15, chloroplastic isoform X1 [Iris pallida]|uniref:Rhodanese-like domain-containing protein 15, chloroplastic isoform X1 n=1 Tax=Iris pallida TaxID=29817 RepID=A0AAX6H899_IRIPA|nr:rhodanese-like domain-containing protein 15, chloroplastic isoform X1 [Iris pallida]
MASCLARFSLPLLLTPPTTNNTFLRSRHAVAVAKKRYRCLPRTSSLLCSVRSMGTGSKEEGEPVVPRSVPVRAAHDLLQAGHRYLDVRTVEEFRAGHPPGATNIPYMFRVGSGMTKNPQFLEEVSSVYKKDDEIIIGCQSGRRSLMAATDLLSAGFTGVTDIAGGYSAWIQNGLPTKQ